MHITHCALTHRFPSDPPHRLAKFNPNRYGKRVRVAGESRSPVDRMIERRHHDDLRTTASNARVAGAGFTARSSHWDRFIQPLPAVCPGTIHPTTYRDRDYSPHHHQPPSLTPDPAHISYLNQSAVITTANLSSLGEAYRWIAHGLPVKDLLFVPGTNRLISAAGNGTEAYPTSLILWDVYTTTSIPWVGAFADANYGFAPLLSLSANGQWLAGGGWVWDVRTGKALGSIIQSAVTGSDAIVGGYNGVLGFWGFNAASAEYLQREDYVYQYGTSQHNLTMAYQLGQPITQVLFDPERWIVVVITEQGDLFRYQLLSEEEPLCNLTQLTEGEHEGIEWEDSFEMGVWGALRPGTTHVA
jgi:hypothetical protein